MLSLAIVLGGFTGLSDLLGSALVLSGRRVIAPWFDLLLPLGTGFVLAIALAELVPSGLEGGPGNAVWILAGFSTLYLITQVFENGESGEKPGVAPGLMLTVLGVALCDFFDGVAVAATVAEVAEAASGPAVASETQALLGWLMLLGLFPHNFLEGTGIALVLLGARLERRWIWLAVVLLASASLFGGVAVQTAVDPALQMAIQAFAGGLLLHLVASQRIPAFAGANARAQAGLVVVGIVMFMGTEAVLGMIGLAV